MNKYAANHPQDSILAEKSIWNCLSIEKSTFFWTRMPIFFQKIWQHPKSPKSEKYVFGFRFLSQSIFPEMKYVFGICIPSPFYGNGVWGLIRSGIKTMADFRSQNLAISSYPRPIFHKKCRPEIGHSFYTTANRPPDSHIPKMVKNEFLKNHTLFLEILAVVKIRSRKRIFQILDVAKFSEKIGIQVQKNVLFSMLRQFQCNPKYALESPRYVISSKYNVLGARFAASSFIDGSKSQKSFFFVISAIWKNRVFSDLGDFATKSRNIWAPL